MGYGIWPSPTRSWRNAFEFLCVSSASTWPQFLVFIGDDAAVHSQQPTSAHHWGGEYSRSPPSLSSEREQNLTVTACIGNLCQILDRRYTSENGKYTYLITTKSLTAFYKSSGPTSWSQAGFASGGEDQFFFVFCAIRSSNSDHPSRQSIDIPSFVEAKPREFSLRSWYDLVILSALFPARELLSEISIGLLSMSLVEPI